MDINKEAHYSYSAQPVKSIEMPKNTKVGVAPAMIVSAITGALLGNGLSKVKAGQEIQLPVKQKDSKNPVLEGDYYKQVQNIAKTLRVIFTPMGVNFVIENNKKPFTIDVIEIPEMDESMKTAWNNKDERYFYNLMLMKMYSDMQLAEQKFSKIFLEKQMNIRKNINKNISKTASEDYSFDDMTDIDYLTCASLSKNIYEKMAQEHKSMISDLLCTVVEKQSSEEFITLQLDRPFEKYANIKNDIKSCLGLSTDVKSVSELKRKLENPKYVSRNIEVSFLPDRVIYLVDNSLVSTIHVSNMDEEKFVNFENKNSKFFKAIFANACKQNMTKIASEETEDILIDGDFDVVDIFTRSDIHPVIYYLVLTNRYGFEWLEFDLAVIERIISNDFGLMEPICDVAIDKIMAIHTANNTSTVYTNAFSFEKIALALSEKPIDFFKRSPELLNIDDVVHVIDVLDRVTPTDDIYDNFSVEVINYICQILSDKDVFTYNPTNIISSPTEPAFNDLVNESLVKMIKRKMTEHTSDANEEQEIESKVDYISDTSFAVLKSFRRFVSDKDVLDINLVEAVGKVMQQSNVRPDLAKIVENQVITNLLVDKILAKKEDTLLAQMNIYKINAPGGELNE